MSEPIVSEQDRTELDLLLRGFQVSRMLRLVADLGIADKIAPTGEVGVNALEKACSVLPERLICVLRALAGFGIFKVSADGNVWHTPRSDPPTRATSGLPSCATPTC